MVIKFFISLKCKTITLILQIMKLSKTNRYKYNPVLTVINGGQFYDVTYFVWNEGEETQSFRTYEEAKALFNAIPLG